MKNMHQTKTSAIPLKNTDIEAHLSCEAQDAFEIFVLPTVDSTSDYVKQIQSTKIPLVCAEMQTKGRGRFGRNWNSPPGENIYLSFCLQYLPDKHALSGFSLVTAIAIHQTLCDMHPKLPFQIKWPNDILIDDKKIAGILTEISTKTHGYINIVVGIGLNVNTNFDANLNIPNATSLFNLTQEVQDRNRIIAKMINNFPNFITKFKEHGLDPFQNYWKNNDYLLNKTIHINTSKEPLIGKVQGINQQGQLLLIDKQGKTHTLSSGEVSLHQL